jgi:hypothetical protein
MFQVIIETQNVAIRDPMTHNWLHFLFIYIFTQEKEKFELVTFI